MSYAMDYPVPVAHARPDERAAFVRRTYLHLAGAILAFVALETALFAAVGTAEMLQIMRPLFGSGFSMIFLMLAFVGVGYLASYWAHHSTSPAMQYAGLGLYVVAEVIIFVPI